MWKLYIYSSLSGSSLIASPGGTSSGTSALLATFTMVILASSPGGALPPGAGSAGARLAQRVEAALATSLNKEPKQIDPKKILVSQYNRMGAPLNVMYIHKTLLRSFLEKGFDYSRPATGVCVAVTSPEAKKKVVEHNKKFTSPSCRPSSRMVFSTLPSRPRT